MEILKLVKAEVCKLRSRVPGGGDMNLLRLHNVQTLKRYCWLSIVFPLGTNSNFVLNTFLEFDFIAGKNHLCLAKALWVGGGAREKCNFQQFERF